MNGKTIEISSVQQHAFILFWQSKTKQYFATFTISLVQFSTESKNDDQTADGLELGLLIDSQTIKQTNSSYSGAYINHKI